MNKRPHLCDAGEVYNVNLIDLNEEPTTNKPSKALRLSSFYNDLPALKKRFGVFSITVGAEEWIANLVGHLKQNYEEPDDFIQYFQSLLDKPFQKWFFALPKAKKATLAELKREFLAKCMEYEREQYEMCDLKKKEFLVKLKSDPDIDQTKLENKPLYTYFEQKLRIHAKMLPSLDKSSTIVRIIFQLDDKDLIEIFYPMKGDASLEGLQTILNRAEFQDSLKD